MAIELFVYYKFYIFYFMNKLIISLILLTCMVGQSFANERVDMLVETFGKVAGSDEATEEINTSQLDNPDGWTFTKAYAGPGCVIIKKGGTVTTPPIAELTGNASFSYSIDMWVDPTGQTEPDYDNLTPHVLSVSGGAELSTDEYDAMVSHMMADCIYGADSQTRLMLTASYDIKLYGVNIYYAASNTGSGPASDYTVFSHDSDNYFAPFNLVLTVSESPYGGIDGKHNILVFTTDGSEPVRTSTRYDGTPIRISETTTVKTATIFGSGAMVADKPRTYTFPQSTAPIIPENTYEITVNRPGSLKSQLIDIEGTVNGVVLKGKINGEDLKYLTAGEGRTGALQYADLSAVEFEYDDTNYRTIVDAPEGGMGTTYTYYYYLSTENRDELSGGSPSNVNTKCYRNNLAAAFSKHKSIQTVVLPDGITTVGERMFDRCPELRAVVMPESLTEVGDMAFYYCTKLELYDFPTTFERIGRSALASVKLGKVRFDNPVDLSAAAFYDSSIAELDMPYPPEEIKDNVFAFCGSLKKISIGEGLKYIGDKAFSYAGITSAELPSSLIELGDGVFDYCPFVDDIEAEDDIVYIGKIAYKNVNYDRSEYTVKDGTVQLCSGLFAFTAASTYNIPASVEIVGTEAFACTKITAMPDMPNLRKLHYGAFRDCKNLERVTIHEFVEYIANPFYGCNSLWSVTYNAIDAECSGLSPRDLERIVIGDKVRRLPAGLYTSNTNVTEVYLPSSIEILDSNVFAGCSNLSYISLSDNISTISDYSFDDCRSLAGIHWPASLKHIGDRAFTNCQSLKTVSLPEGVECVEYGAFDGCTGVETFYLASTATEIGYGAFTFRNTDKKLTITTTALSPIDYEWSWYYMGTPLIKVPAAALDAYKASANWNNGNKNEIVAIEGITVTAEETETSFGSDIDADTDLSDTVVGDVYVTVGEEDGYDETDGSIVLNSTMDEEYMDAVGGMAPGESDIANRYNGLVVQVAAGNGSVTIHCLTLGSKRVAVKIGKGEATFHTMNSKGDITVNYDVHEDTYVYIYASDSEALNATRRQMRAQAPATDSCIKIYSVGVHPKSTGIGNVTEATDCQSPIVEYYRVDGTRVDAPSIPGIYIGRRADGSTIKVVLK